MPLHNPYTHFIHFLLCPFLLLFSFCNRNTKPDEPKLPVIILQPFAGLPENYATFISRELKKQYPSVEIRPVMALPASALNASRTRYRADSLIRILSAMATEDQVIIGLTTKDISTTKGQDPDWGVMGLGYRPGSACVASSFRLDKKKKVMQLFKVVIHEFGHTRNLDHCANTTCYMRDAEGKNHTDEETGFCEDCKEKLARAGWDPDNKKIPQ